MKKETVKTFVILVLVILVVFLSVKSMKYYQKSQEKPETVYLTDTIVNVEWDTVYLERYKTVKLPIADTTVYYIADTVTRVDSVFVEVPISIYQIDTTFSTDTTVFNLSIQIPDLTLHWIRCLIHLLTDRPRQRLTILETILDLV